MELWIDPHYVRAGYSWSSRRRRAADRRRLVRAADRVKEPTVELAARPRSADAVGFQGNWIPHSCAPATEDGVFFVGDSAGHCLPLTAEGIRPAFYFALALRARASHTSSTGARTRDQALERYGSFSAAAPGSTRRCSRAQHLFGRVTSSAALRGAVRFFGIPLAGRWAFRHYLAIAPPHFASSRPPIAATASAGGAPRVGMASA